MKRLYRVSSLIDNVIYNHRTYDKVPFNWFAAGREIADLPYEEMIINYPSLSEPNKKNARRYINELFSEEEAIRLKSELDRKSNSITTIEEVTLPVPDHIEPFGSLKSETGKGFTVLTALKSYKFPFKIKGFFNLANAFESLQGDDHPTQITRLPENLRKDLE